MTEDTKHSLTMVWVMLMLFMPLNFGCSTVFSKNPSVKRPPVVGPEADLISLKGKKVGFIDVMRLPTDYLSGFSINERVFTGEVYTQNPTAP